MKVLLIDVNCKNSSTGKIVFDLYQKLNNDGHEAAICYGRGDIVEGKNIFKFGLDWETNVHAGLARITGFNGYFSYFSTKRLIKFIEEFKPDVVHIHELHAYFVNSIELIKYLKKKNVKIIWTFHCEYMYTGKCGHAYECQNWLTQCKNCPAVREYPKSLYFDFTKKMFNDKKESLKDLEFSIITPSQWLLDRVKLSFLKNKKISVIHNGIDTENVFHLADNDKILKLKEKFNLTNKKIVLSVAPNIMSESKGGFKVLEISKIFADINTHFVLVGAENDEKFSENVTLIKRTKNQEELALWYSAADVFLICSKRENFPTTCLEALSCGTPIVGIDSGGTKETAPEPYGLFYKDQDLEGIINGIKTQLNKEFDKKEISKLGSFLYDKKNMFKEYLKVYEQ